MNLQNKIAELSLNKFASLPKTGKPNNSEWTVMSTIVKNDTTTNKMEVISLGTGSKCIGANFMSKNGDILNDSHAEIICRRAFLKYLYNEINSFLQMGNSEIFIKDEQNSGKCTIKEEISFHLFSTHVPCGDASIFSKNEIENFGTCLIKNYSYENLECKKSVCSENIREKQNVLPNNENEDFDTCLIKNDSSEKLECKKYVTSENIREKQNVLLNNEDIKCRIEDNEEPISKKIKVEFDIFRTGAKCLKEDLRQDSKKPGIDYHILGAVRTKPGRGDPTLSVSCSDKIAKWTLLGIQGSFLFRLLQKPIYLSSITIAGGVPFSEEAMKRSICERTKMTLMSPFEHTTPKITQTNIKFEFCKNDSKQPCPSSIIWFKNCKKVEVAVEGKKQGVTKKNKNTKAGRSSICKKELFSDFCNIVKKYSNYFNIDIKDYNCYFDWKNAEKNDFEYFILWNKIKKDIFKVWPCKSKDLLLFTCFD